MTAEEILIYVRDSYLRKPNRYHLFVFIWGRLIRSSIIKENSIFFNEDMCTYEDVTFNFDCLHLVKTLMFVNKPVLTKTVIVHDGFALASKFTEAKGRTQFGHLHACHSIQGYLHKVTGGDGCDSVLQHASTVYTIIQLIRVCGQLTVQNHQALYNLVKEIAHDPAVRHGLEHYQPTGADSRIIPWLIKMKAVRWIIKICYRKNKARYKKTVGK